MVIRNDRDRQKLYCSTTANFAQNYTQKKTHLENVTGERNATNIK